MSCQGQWSDKPHGALVQHLETIERPFRQEYIVLFKIRHHARNRNAPFYHSSQPVTYFLTITDSFSEVDGDTPHPASPGAGGNVQS